MSPIDYTALLEQAIADYSKLLFQRQEIEYELAQKEQFIRATVNMLPEERKAASQALLDMLSAGDVGLSDSIRNVLKAAPGKFYTATEVKQLLVSSGFDFSRYTSNPLSSVHAALKRLKPDEAEMNQIDGVMAWRWVKGPSGPSELERQKILAELAARHGRTAAVPLRNLGRKIPIPLPDTETPGQPSKRPVVDLMAALKKSLADMEQRKTTAFAVQQKLNEARAALRAAAEEEEKSR